MKKNGLFFLILLSLIAVHFLIMQLTQWQLPKKYIQQPVIIQGIVDAIPEKKYHGIQFQFFAKQINHHKIATHFLLSWYQHPPRQAFRTTCERLPVIDATREVNSRLHLKGRIAIPPFKKTPSRKESFAKCETPPRVKVGQRWILSVKLKPPIGSHNPGGFDYAHYLLSHGITATGYVITRQNANQLTGYQNDFINRNREKIQKNIDHAIKNPTLAAFISALCVGLRDGLTESDWAVFQKTGTNHLVAIAGLHIGFVFSMLYFSTKYSTRFFPKFLLVIPALRIAEIIAFGGALGYAGLSGFAIPAQRASLMLIFFMGTTWCCRKISAGRKLFFSAMVMLLINPNECGDMSFWLSFTSIFCLMVVVGGRLQSPKHLILWIKMQGALMIGLLPLMLLFFQQVSLIAFVTNAVAIPWIGFVILPLSFLAMLLFFLKIKILSHALFWLSGKLLSPLWFFLKVAAHFSLASWHHAIANKYVLVAAMIGSLFVLAPRGFSARFLGCFGLLPLFFYHPASPAMGDYRATVIDVGQGLSVLVQTAHHVMLYDTGAHFPGGFDFGESVVAPYLRLQDIKMIDRLEISHGDNDHSGGADAIVRDFQVKNIFTSAPKLMAHFHANPCFAGQAWVWDQVHFMTMNPTPDAPYADNNSSCVIKVTGKHGSLLLTGDIQQSTESALVQHYGSQLQSTVLLVPHHGSKTSSSAAFIQAVSPQYAIISAGKYNRYHLPAERIVSRYERHPIQMYNTADSGAIMIRFSHQGDVRLSSFVENRAHNDSIK